MKTKSGLFLLITLIITIRVGFAQGVQEVKEFPNLIKNGDFEDGYTGFKSDFIYSPDDYLNWGYYVITTHSSKYLGGGVFVDPVPSTGKYYFIDMNNSGKQRLWYDSVTVKPNTTYEFSAILANVEQQFTAPGVISLQVSGKKICPSKTLSGGSPAWGLHRIQFKTLPNETRIEIAIVDEIWTLMGNDVTLDNIVLKEIPATEFTSNCPDRGFPKLKEEEKGVLSTVKKVERQQTQIVAARVEEKRKDSVAVVEKKKADSVAVVVAKQKVIEKRKKDSVEVVVAKKIEVEKKKADSVAVVVAKQKADSVIAVVTKQKADSVAAVVAVVTKPKDPEKPKDPVVIKVDPIRPKDPVVIRTKDPVVIRPKDPVIKPKDPEKPKDPVKPKPKPKPTEPIKFTKDISDEDLQEGVKLEMGHIYFDQGKAQLQDASKVELGELIDLMKKHPKLRIRLEGHTTNDGNPQKNIVLSEDRVKEVKKYLVENGIADSRVEWIGYGGAKPLNSGSTPELKKLNRRVEVEIIENSK